MPQDKDVEALIALGLTTSQAKVYLALTRLGEAKILTISKKTQIARQDLYRVMAELENRCLIERVLATPVRFKAAPIQEAVALLLQRMHKQASEARNEAIGFIKRHRHRVRSVTAQEKEIKFVLIPEKEAISRRLKRSIEDAQRSIDIVCPRKTCLQALFDLAPALRKALERNVKVRWIIDKALAEDTRPYTLETFLDNSLFKLRNIADDLTQTFSIYDNKIILVASYPNLDYVQSPALWTNAEPMVELAQHYFDTLWSKAEKDGQRLAEKA
jgi:sugar-specific transcriptional regulator TrmB